MLQFRWVRTIGLVLLTIGAPVAALFFLQPTKVIGAKELEAPPIGSFVEVRVDRIEPLPWTFVQKDDGTVTNRFSLGWIGKRALIIETGDEVPPGPTVTGELHRLGGSVASWASESRQIDAASFDAILEVGPRYQRVLMGAAAGLVSLAVLIAWVMRFRRWRSPSDRS